MLIFEISGVILAMLGAWYMSKGFAQKENAVKTFALFLTSNVMFINMAIGAMLIPLIVQMLFFTAFAVMGIKTFAPELVKRVVGLLALASIPTLFNMVISFGVSPVFDITAWELVAATAAITGSYLLRSPRANERLAAFTLFILADAIYIVVGLENGLYLFALQAAYFLYTSVVGIFNTRKQSNTASA